MTRLVEFKTGDNLFLVCLLFEPERKADKVLIMLHGNGSSSVFYSVPKVNLMARELNAKWISYFPFNNRGAHYIKKLKIIKEVKEDDVKIGTAYELIKDCIQDIDGAIDYLESQGYREFYLIGHSTGANKICVYNFYKPENRIAKYILAGGGDDSGIYYQMMGTKKFNKALEMAKKEIARGNGRKLVPKYLVDYLISYQSLYDTINPDGDYNTFPFNEYLNNLKLTKKELFREYKTINKPTLVIYGANDEYCWGDVPRIAELLKKQTTRPDLFNYEIVENADHGFDGNIEGMTEKVVNWLVK